MKKTRAFSFAKLILMTILIRYSVKLENIENSVLVSILDVAN